MDEKIIKTPSKDEVKQHIPEADKEKSDNTLSLLIAFGAVIFFFVSQLIFGVGALAVVSFDLMQDGVSQGGLMKALQDPATIALPSIISVLLSNIFVFGILMLYLRRKGRLEKLGWNRWSAIGAVPTLAVAIACIASALIFNFIYTQYIFPDLEMQSGMKELFAAIPDTLPNQILLFATVAIAAPIIEEVIFRGMLQTSLAKMMPAWAAILLSALIFAAIHMQPAAIGALAALGIAFGVIYHVTKSLRATILLHVVNNAAALILQPLAEEAAKAEKTATAIMPVFLF